MRRLYIDWMRAIAVLCMIEHHTFDAFLSPGLRGSRPDRLFRFLGGVAAPAFLFLAGLAVVLMLERRPDWRRAARRGLLIMGGAYLFRLQEWALWFGAARLSDLLRLDILNVIGLALLLVALLWGALRRPLLPFAALALLIALATPALWAAPLAGLPPLLAGYLRGRTGYALFPLFPWLGHAFAGAAVGVLLARRTVDEAVFMRRLALGAAAVAALALLADALPVRLFPGLDWWDTSPAYFLLRTCSNVLLLAACWLLERVLRPAAPGLAARLGRHSLVIYWVHIEVVYGRWFWRARGTLDLWHGALALAGVLAMMVALAYLIQPLKALPVFRVFEPRTAPT